MADPRFYQPTAGISLAALAEQTGAKLARGNGTLIISQAAPLSGAGAADVAFLQDKRRLDDLRLTRAGAVFVTDRNTGAVPDGCAILSTPHPQAAWAQSARLLHPPIFHDDSAGSIHPSAHLEPDVVLGPGVVVGQGAHIGAGSVIEAGAVIGPGVAIGRSCRIGANASVRFTLAGDRVHILAGARLGEAGFGVATGPGGPVDVPQVGRVIVQDNVTIGANSCVDRGAWDDTVIGENTKIDNLCHIAHNVKIGRNCRLAAHTGISGSVTIGDNVLFGGKAGVADQLKVGEGAAVGAAASVFRDIPPGATWSGFPARPLRQWLREQAALARLVRGKRGKGNGQEQE